MHFLRMPASSARGVTLIELMVTIAVLAILLTLAAPSFSEFFERTRLRAAVDDVQNLLASARSAAVQTDRDVAVAFGGTTAAWCVGARAALDPATAGALVPPATACTCAVGNGASCTIAGSRMVVDSTGKPGVTVSTVDASFTYDAKTGALGNLAPLSVNFTSATGKYVLQLGVSPLGHARTCVPAGQPTFPGVPSC